MTDSDHPTMPLTSVTAMAAVADALRRIAPELDLDAVDRSAPLRDELDLDSMDVLSMITALSDHIGSPIAERDAAEMTSVDALVDYLVRRTA